MAMSNNPFFKEFLLHPFSTGAIRESSPGLVQLITSIPNLSAASSVIELGSGTGVFTKSIQDKIQDSCVFFALEANSKFVETTRKSCPGAMVHEACASEILRYMALHGLPECDVIISGLPWASLSSEKHESLMQSIYRALAPGGEFITFSYVHSSWLAKGRHFAEVLDSSFPVVEKTSTVWRNIPPAFAYYCRK